MLGFMDDVPADIDLSDWVTPADHKSPGAVQLRLQYPISRKVRSSGDQVEDPIDHLILHRPRVKDLALLDGQAGKSLQGIMAFIKGIVRDDRILPQHLEEMDGNDLMRVGAVIMDFFPMIKAPGSTGGNTQSS